ncbi:MAG: DUF177 domain-containing protein [Melioribacteraceae bacterium]|nr:DUF177 domain-containing protein [Melioribacteraceae bacterium]
MKFKFTNYEDGIHQIDFKKSADELDLDEQFTGDVLLNCRMDKSTYQIVLNCDFSADTELICDRCNEKFIFRVSNNFQNIYLFSSEEETDDVNIHYLSLEQDKIDLSKDVSEYAKFAIPMKKLCSESCKGLCPHCGINLNEKKCNCKTEETNPVWDKLQKLK